MIRSLLIVQVVLIANLSQAQEKITMDTVLYRHFEAVGGYEHWQEIKTCYTEQSCWSLPVDTQPHQQFLGDHLPTNQNIYYKYPGQYRGNIYSEGQQKLSVIISPEEYKYYLHRAEHEGVHPDPELGRAIHELTYSTYHLGPSLLLVKVYQDKVLAYEGEGEVFGKLCHKLVVTKEQPLGGRVLIYLDAETYRAHALVHTQALNRNKLYDDYRTVNGLLIPHRMRNYHEGTLYEEYTIDTIEINQAIDDLVFTVW